MDLYEDAILKEISAKIKAFSAVMLGYPKADLCDKLQTERNHCFGSSNFYKA
jgi:hypothetical protein